MPRQTDVVAECKDLEKALRLGDQTKRQYAVRIELPTAVQLLRDCCRQNRLPGLVLKDVIENYYATWEKGVHVILPDLLRSGLDQLADLLDCDREQALLELVKDSIGDSLRKARAERQKIESVVHPDAPEVVT